jgi:acetyl-CoA synthetase
MVQRHKITQFYTAPTAIRTLMKSGPEWVKKYDLSTLRVLGSVGEPINPEVWRWYYDVVGNKKCPIVDTFWQTETAGHMMTGLPGSHMMKPGSCSLPAFGVKPAVLDPTTGQELTGNDVAGVLCFAQSWPSMIRSVYGDHQRYLDTYLKPYPGYYLTGDGCVRDKDGYYWITGRVDDVIGARARANCCKRFASSCLGNTGLLRVCCASWYGSLKKLKQSEYVQILDYFVTSWSGRSASQPRPLVSPQGPPREAGDPDSDSEHVLECTDEVESI